MARSRGEHAVFAGDGIRVGVERGGVHHAAGRGAAGGERNAHAVIRRDRVDGGVDEVVGSGLGGRRRRDGAQRAAAHGVFLAGAEEDLSLDVGGPGGRQAPRAGDALADEGGLETGSAENLAQASLHGLAQDGTERGVARGGGGDLLAQGLHVCVGGAVDGRHTQLRGHVHEQLVTTRGHAVGELLDGVRVGDLVDANLVLEREEHVDGLCRAEGQLRRVGGAAGGRSGSRRGSLGLRGGGGLGLSRGGIGKLRLRSLLDRGGLDVLQHDLVLVALDVEDGHVDAGDGHGALRHVGQRRGGSEADLDDLLDMLEEEVLRLDPADRGGELPRQQLDDEETGEFLLVHVLDLEAVELAGRGERRDRVDEVLGEFERTGHKVRDVAAHELRQIEFLREQLVELLSEGRNTVAQDAGVERDVDARDHDGGARRDGICAADQLLETGLGAGHRVLLTLDVVVDDFEEFAGLFAERVDPGVDLVAGNAHHVGAQRCHGVVGVTLRVALDERAHGGAAGVDDVDNPLELKDVRERSQGGVLAEGVAGVETGWSQRVVLAQALGLGVRDDGEGHLRELGEVQHAVRVAELDALDFDGRGVLVDDALDAEAKVVAGVTVRATPDFAGGRGRVAVAATHADGLDALARVDVGGLRCGKQRLAARDDLAADAAGDLQRGVDALAAHALDGDVDLVIELDHAVHGVGPAHDLAVARGEVLRGGRQPHAVDERRLQVDQLRRVVGGVNGVVVAGDQRERRHIVRRGDGRTIHEGARRGLDLGGRLAAAPLRSRDRHRGAGGAAADGEALHLRSDDVLGVMVAQFEFDGDDTAGNRLVNGRAPGGHVDGATIR